MSQVFSGSFSPVTQESVNQLLRAFGAGEPVTIRLIGAERARSTRSPWTVDEREAMLRAALGPLAARATFRSVVDHPYRPDLEQARADIEVADSDAVRGDFLRHGVEAVATAVPEAIRDFLCDFAATPEYQRLHAEQLYIDDYRKSWEVAPWPPIFVTCDALIQHGQHLLLIRRGGQPGKGLWALPGGFVETDETLLASAVREVREETRLDLDDAQVEAHLVASHVFDDPQRSARGRTITHAWHFRFPEGNLPPVEAADDAAGAHWVALDDLAGMRDEFFEDHFDIIDYFRLIKE